MKVFKSIGIARRHAAEGQPILRVGNEYIVGEFTTLTQFEIIAADGCIVANVGLGHLLRLGNANHAEPKESMKGGYYMNADKQVVRNPQRFVGNVAAAVVSQEVSESSAEHRVGKVQYVVRFFADKNNARETMQPVSGDSQAAAVLTARNFVKD